MEKNTSFKDGNISLVLNSYDDIFSGFDPRPYSQRSLSDDFLQEARRASRDKFDEIEIRLMVPRNKRNIKDEVNIQRRLRQHFQRHFEMEQKSIKSSRKEGILWCIFGAILLVGSTFLYEMKLRNFFINFLFIISQPAGWFLFWEGLGLIIFKSREKKPEYDFYRKMAKCNLEFVSY